MGRGTLRSGDEELMFPAFFEKLSFGAECDWCTMREMDGGRLFRLESLVSMERESEAFSLRLW